MGLSGEVPKLAGLHQTGRGWLLCSVPACGPSPVHCCLAAACAAWTVAWRLRTQHVTPLLLCLYPVFTLTQPPPSPHSVTGRCNDLIHQQDILSPQCPVQCSQCGWRPGCGHVNFRLPTQQQLSPAQPASQISLDNEWSAARPGSCQSQLQVTQWSSEAAETKYNLSVQPVAVSGVLPVKVRAGTTCVMLRGKVMCVYCLSIYR